MSTQKNYSDEELRIAKLQLKELRHRTSNFMNMLRSMIHIKQEKLQTEEAQFICSEMLCIVDAYTQVFHLIGGNNTGGAGGDNNSNGYFKAEHLFQPLIANLRNFPKVRQQQISLESEIGELQLKNQHAIPLALITVESFTNTLKYAFPPEYTGPRRFLVHLEKKSNSEVSADLHRLVLTDTGVGSSLGKSEDAGGSGIAIMKSLAQQIEGRLELDFSTGAVLQLHF